MLALTRGKLCEIGHENYSLQIALINELHEFRDQLLDREEESTKI